MLRLDGAPNFRDLGGIPTIDGRLIHRGRIFRSDLLSGVTEKDRVRLNSSDIRGLCDLRNRDERTRGSYLWPGARTVTPIRPLSEGSVEGLAAVQWTKRRLDPEFDASCARAFMLDSYVKMPRKFSGFLASLFSYLVAADSGAVLIHCVAGKDRTGFVCAMLLSALGVALDEIYRDYLLSGGRFALTGWQENTLNDLFGKNIPKHAMEAAAVVGGAVRCT
jgi:protein-tyrosine phosphatase